MRSVYQSVPICSRHSVSGMDVAAPNTFTLFNQLVSSHGTVLEWGVGGSVANTLGLFPVLFFTVCRGVGWRGGVNSKCVQCNTNSPRHSVSLKVIQFLLLLFTCRVTLYGRRHVWPWLCEFCGVSLSCFPLSRMTV